MSDPKTTAETLGRVVGDFLKWEATPLTRTPVAAAKGTKAGTFVDYAPRAGKKLLALTDEQDGIVIVQPHNCIIDLTLVADAAVKAAASAGGNLDGLKRVFPSSSSRRRPRASRIRRCVRYPLPKPRPT